MDILSKQHRGIMQVFNAHSQLPRLSERNESDVNNVMTLVLTVTE